MISSELWRSFNLGDANEDPGGSWLYAMRYSADNLREHQETVIAKMQRMGVSVFQLPDGTLGMGADHEFSEDDMHTFMILTEELTITNEALEHARLELYGKSTVDLMNMYKSSFMLAVSTGDKRRAAGMLRLEMPQVVSDLTRAQFDNEPLSETDYQAVTKLGNFAAGKIDLLLNGGATVVISNNAPPQTLTGNDLPQF